MKKLGIIKILGIALVVSLVLPALITAPVSIGIDVSNQTPAVEWDKTFGGSANDVGAAVQQTTDGGYILTGSTGSYGAGGYNYDAWLIKTDSNGNKVWDMTFGEAKGDIASSVQQTTDGGYILTGSTGSYGAGEADVWLIKTDSNGNKVWDMTFGGAEDDGTYSVQQTIDGGYILTGSTRSYGAGENDVWLIKTDSNGNEVWDITFGGAEDDSAWSLQQTTDGGYILAGRTVSYGAGAEDIWVIKNDSNGNKVWDMTFGGAQDDGARSVQQTTDGGYIVTGFTGSYGAGGVDVWIIKLAAETQPTPTAMPTPSPTSTPTPTPTTTPTPTPAQSEDAFNYQCEYELDWDELTDDERCAYPYVIKYAKEYEVSPALIMGVIRQESNFHQNANGNDYIGYMQVSWAATTCPGMPNAYTGTKADWHVEGKDPDRNITYGTRYLRILNDIFEDGKFLADSLYAITITDKQERINFVLASYNGGQGRIAQAQQIAESTGKDPTKWEEVKNYLVDAGATSEKAEEIKKYVEQVIKGRDLINDQYRGYEFFLTIRTTQNPKIVVELHSPAELRVYDSQGQITGVVDGEEKSEIPNSSYYENMVTILSPTDSYIYEVVGTGEGSYDMTVNKVTEEDSTTFAASDIATSASAVHQYTIEWDALSEDEQGVTVEIDSDGDGTFEKTITEDSDFTQDEYLSAIAKEENIPVWAWIVIGVLAALIVLLVAIIFRNVLKRPPAQIQRGKQSTHARPSINES